MDIPGGQVDNHSVDESAPSTFTSTAVDGSSSSTATAVDDESSISTSVDWSSDSSEAQFQMDDLVPQPDLVAQQPHLVQQQQPHLVQQQQQPDLVPQQQQPHLVPQQQQPHLVPQPDLGSGGSPGRLPSIPQPDLGSGGSPGRLPSIPEPDLGSIKSQSPLSSSTAATDISIIPAVKQVAGSFLNILMSSYNFQGPTTNVQHISNLSDGAIRHVYDYIVRAGPSLGIYPPPPPAAAETETGGVGEDGIAEPETETGGVAVDGNVEAETGGEETGIEDYSSPS